ncbi:hypothetical protein ACE8EZ_12955 [Pantoea deleyi]|uniref:hypothetical protein n=1 Tax=Pantoea deleyi TaxID=470932 RepID=UPI0035D443EC
MSLTWPHVEEKVNKAEKGSGRLTLRLFRFLGKQSPDAPVSGWIIFTASLFFFSLQYLAMQPPQSILSGKASGKPVNSPENQPFPADSAPDYCPLSHACIFHRTDCGLWQGSPVRSERPVCFAYSTP